MARPLRVEFEDAIYHLCLDYAAVAQRIRRMKSTYKPIAARRLITTMLNVRFDPDLPPDGFNDSLTAALFVMSTDGFACSMTFEWIEKETYNYRACSIDGKRFSRE